MDNYTVYMHRFPNGKVYIGITSKKPELRWLSGKGYQTQNVYKAILKYGWENIEHIILLSGLSKEEAERKEVELISMYDSTNPEKGYNIENGGDSTGKHSEATREKISRNKKGWNPSEETRRKMSEAKKGKPISEALRKALTGRPGKPLSEKQKAALLAANIGRVVSEETRKRQSESHKGKKLPEEQRKKISESGKISQRKCKAVRVIQFDLDGNQIRIWDCMTDITEELGISQPHICSCCKGKRKTTGGFKWRYADK